MQHDQLNIKLKPFFNMQIERQENKTAREKYLKSRNRWRIAALVFMFLFLVESCAPEPEALQQDVEQAQ